MIKTERFENVTQASMDTMCHKINQQLADLDKQSLTKTMSKKARSKWSFIKSPICNLEKTSAPYIVIFYGNKMINILQSAGKKTA